MQTMMSKKENEQGMNEHESKADKPKIILIDNYDSFSYNLYQLVGEIEPEIKVVRNDEMTVEEIKELAPERIILSPGPGRPEDAGIIVDLIKQITEIPILGVCLGHQAICMAYGAEIGYASRLMHGKQSDVTFDGDCPLFKDIPHTAPVARYHSLAAYPANMGVTGAGEGLTLHSFLTDELMITACTAENEVMAVRHVRYPIYGVQFHPESIMTPDGKQMLRNFIWQGDGKKIENESMIFFDRISV